MNDFTDLTSNLDAKSIGPQTEKGRKCLERINDLRRRYDRSLPAPTTDAQWEQVRESVLHEHRLSQVDRVDQLVKQTAARYRP